MPYFSTASGDTIRLVTIDSVVGIGTDLVLETEHDPTLSSAAATGTLTPDEYQEQLETLFTDDVLFDIEVESDREALTYSDCVALSGGGGGLKFRCADLE